MKLEHGIASHDAIGQVFGMLDARAVESCFRRWVSGRIPVLEPGTVVAVDGKTRRRSGSEACRPLHLVSALAVKDNHPKLAESIRDFFATGKANHWANVHHDDYATVEKITVASKCGAITPSGTSTACPIPVCTGAWTCA